VIAAPAVETTATMAAATLIVVNFSSISLMPQTSRPAPERCV
jgi:hypothetical protein